MSVLIDLTGQRFGRFTVLRMAPTIGRKTYWECLCDCGTVKVVQGSHLKSGHTQTCGCLRTELLMLRNFKHGLNQTRAYRTWDGMKQRCLNPKCSDYKHYGGRGIRICDRWMSFENFYADMGERPVGMTLDRINNDLGYEPNNCRWATPKGQANNRRPPTKAAA